MQPTMVSGVPADYLHAINAGDLDAAVACFADDGYVNDARREFLGTAAVRRWIAKEMVGDHVRIDVREVLEHHGDLIIRGAYDGTFDKTNLPAELILTSYVSVRDEKIVSLVIIFTQPADY
ncbi:nuclear transport factor 2 family protein [Streptomyces sp. SID4917]|nr:nuclear transport factor 2 family protein [Streptomyces sp. SID4917]SCF64995.1 SnoaL-like domain-containing protein [Streptomyces sp. MnatMP-M17]